MRGEAGSELMPLWAAPEKRVWRKRGWAEVEEVVGPGPGARRVERLRLQSFPAHQHTALHFVNAGPHTARVVWLDFRGHEVPYGLVLPQQAVRYSTYQKHVWLCRDAATGGRLMLNNGELAVVGGPSEVSCLIYGAEVTAETPPSCIRLPPCACRREVRELLLCHRRLARAAAAANDDGSGGATLGCLPRDMVMRVVEVVLAPLPTRWHDHDSLVKLRWQRVVVDVVLSVRKKQQRQGGAA